MFSLGFNIYIFSNLFKIKFFKLKNVFFINILRSVWPGLVIIWLTLTHTYSYNMSVCTYSWHNYFKVESNVYFGMRFFPVTHTKFCMIKLLADGEMYFSIPKKSSYHSIERDSVYTQRLVEWSLSPDGNDKFW